MPSPAASPMLLKSALYYARNFGWKVFPLHNPVGKGCSCSRPDCGRIGKHPRTQHGLKDATSDEQQITAWWKRWPHANIGVAAGRVSGFVVLDIDPRNGGEVSLEALLDRYGRLPDTVQALTGGGGWHHLFACPPGDLPLRSRGASELGAGIDVKADGGYIVVAPSVHPSGKPYAWEASSRPGEVVLAPPPPWFVAVLEQRPEAPPATGSVAQSYLGVAFAAAGMLGKAIDDQRAAVRCPWAAEHTTGGPDDRTDTSTVIFAPTASRTMGWFHCSHSHCAARTLKEVLAVLPPDALAQAEAAFPKRRQRPPPSDDDDAPTVDSQSDVGPVTAAGYGETEHDETWKEDLAYAVKKDGTRTILPTLQNAVTILACDPDWDEVLAFDAFRHETIARKAPSWHLHDAPHGGAQPGVWTDEDDTRAANWLSRVYGLRLATQRVAEAVRIAARRLAVHPVRDYLGALRHDGVPRLDTWLTDYLGVPDTPYARSVGRWWLTSSVARIYQPGCKADHVLILEGAQGKGKSAALKALVAKPAWYTDTPIRIGDKDGFLALRGRQLVELAELDSVLRADDATSKAFFSSPTDAYRPPYGRTVIDVPRQCVFAGSVNPGATGYLRDQTGGRRYWPVSCNVTRAINLAGLEAARDQLWAEAVLEYHHDRPWWPSADLVPVVEAQQESRTQADAWEDVISRWLDTAAADNVLVQHGHIAPADVLGQALKLDPSRWGRAEQTRAGVCMGRLKWRRRRVTETSGRRAWVYLPPLLPGQTEAGDDG